MTLTDNALICSQCYYFLKNIETFRTRSIEVQKKLVSYNMGFCMNLSDLPCSNYMYSTQGTGKDGRTRHTLVPIRATEEKTMREQTSYATITLN